MIDLNEHAKKAREIEFNLWKKNDGNYHTSAILKHCAGEVCEAELVCNQYLHEAAERYRNKLAEELADIITCALIAAANVGIDIEKALQEFQQKKRREQWRGQND